MTGRLRHQHGLFAELVVDSFAGGGGASLGIERALGRCVDIAINHDAEAVAMHEANHPDTRHYCENAWAVDPLKATGGRPVGLAWFSPDCKHFSRAKGTKPVEKKIRGLAWIVIRCARAVRPRVICLENVEEFETWGPLVDGRPCPIRKGNTFRRWLGALRKLGYQVEWRSLRACDYGAPTTRRRLFLVARCDGQPILWPEPTHGAGRALPWRTAAECIEWALRCPSIFERSRPLAEATQRRIAAGIRRFVIESPRPFVLPIDMPLAVAALTKYHGDGSQPRGQLLDEPLRTVDAANRFGLVSGTLIQSSWGERAGQAPRVPGLDKPLGTIMAGGVKHALVAAWLAKHYGGVVGQPMGAPAGTVTARDHHAVVASHLTKFYGTSVGQEVAAPMPTITAQGWHLGEVRAFLTKYFGNATGQELADPLHTVTARARFGLVRVEGEAYQIADIGMRMLEPRELYRAQGFPDSYVIAPTWRGKPLTKTAQIRMAGNSVPPDCAEMLVRANFGQQSQLVEVA